MKLRVGLGVLLVAVLACGELAAPRSHPIALTIIPAFDRYGELAAGADQLQIRIYAIVVGPPRDSTLVKDTTVAVTGDSASADVGVVLLQSPETFRIRLDAKTSTGAGCSTRRW